MTEPPAARKRTVLVGVGGHARAVLRALSARADVEVVCGVDPALEAGEERYGLAIAGDDGSLAALRREGIEFFAMGLGGIGDNGPRRESFARAVRAGMTPLGVVDPDAVVAADARLGAGVFVAPGAVVCAGATLGDDVIVNTRAVVEHDCTVGEHAHVASGAVLCGGVRVGAGAHIGAAAVVRQYLEIGADALVGIGAVVVESVPPGARVAGNPARSLRKASK